MKIKILFTLLILPIFAFTQNFSLSGNIQNKNKEALVFANITLQTKDTIYIKSSVSDNNGIFILKNIKKDTYLIKITSFGFQEYTNKITIAKNVILKPIILTEKIENLTEIELNTTQPSIQQKTDRLVFKLNNSILSNNTTWEILKNTPSVFVFKDNLMVNNSPAAVYINNKKVQLSQNELRNFLESYAGNTVKSIEVLANPSAKYDANGNAIINIITKKNKFSGYKGSAFADYTQGIYAKYNFGMNHFYKKNKWDVFANYTYSPSTDFIFMDESINYFDNANNLESTWLAKYDIKTTKETHNLLFNVDYSIDKKNKITLSTLHYIQPKEVTNNDTFGEIFDQNNQLNNTYKAISNFDKDTKNLSYSLDYSRKLKKEGAYFNTSISYNYYNKKDEQDVVTNYFSSNQTITNTNGFLINSNQKININTYQVDYGYPIDKTINFEAGAKFANITSKSQLKQDDYFSGNTQNSDTFLYDETNFAGYLNLNKKWKKWSAQFGLRAELTKTKGNSISTSQINTNNYFTLFPTLYLNYNPSKNHIFSFSYGKRINRPKYAQLNPFTYYFSDFAANVGNPDLKPAIENKIDLTYMLQRKYRFNFFFTHEKDKAEELSFQDNDTNFVWFVISNLKQKVTSGFSFYTNYKLTNLWSISTTYALYYKETVFQAQEPNPILVTQNTWRNILLINNNFTLLKDKSLQTSVNFGYSSGNIMGSYKQSERKYIHLNFSKKILKNNGTISLKISDIFNTDNLNFRSTYLDQDNGYYQKNESQKIKIGFRYNFGNRKLKENKTQKSTKEQNRVE